MIPKRIIYCWFGSNKPTPFMESCMESWKTQCPDYEIIKVDETVFDVNSNEYSKEAYKHGNYSFVSDVARLWSLKQWSGIYLDTDIRLVKPLDELLQYDAFIPMSGVGFYTSGCLGCDKFPRIFEEAYEQLKDGRVVNELLNELCYEKYDVHGGLLEVQDNIAFLGNEYFVVPGYSKGTHTIGLHYANGLWNNAWKGSYDRRRTLKEFEIYQDGARDTDAEKKIYGNVLNPTQDNIIGKLETHGLPVTGNHVFYGNYFYNPRVMKVKGNGFELERYNKKPIKKTMCVENVILECSE